MAPPATIRDLYRLDEIHGLPLDPCRTIQRSFVQAGHIAFVPRDRAGRDASPVLTPAAAASWLLGRLAGGGKAAAETVAGLWFLAPATPDHAEPESAHIATAADADPGLAFHKAARCPITGSPNLGDALRAVLADSTLAASIRCLQVRIGAHDVVLVAIDGRKTRFASAEALAAVAKDTETGKVQTFSQISGRGLASIARLIAGD
jgi:hypothetical protein